MAAEELVPAAKSRTSARPELDPAAAAFLGVSSGEVDGFTAFPAAGVERA